MARVIRNPQWGASSRRLLQDIASIGACCILALLLAAFAVSAQVTTADVLGTATDVTGAVVPGVSILVKNLNTGAEYSTVTNNTGNYIIRLLPPGGYSMRAEAAGFKAWTVAAVTVASGDRLRQDIRLEVGEVTQTVEVTAQTPALQSESSTLGTLITERAVQDLPLNGRNFINLVQLAAGAIDPAGTTAAGWATGANPDDRRRTSAVSVNAQPGTANNYMVDGMDNNERFIGSLIIKPSIEAMAEMRVQSSLYSAEIGRVSGGVMNIITKSGTNEFHGSAFEFFRNEKLDARNFFARGVRPPFKQHQFGFSLGGPVVRNRTFFFGDFEEYRAVLGQTFVSTVPATSLRSGVFTGVAAVYDPASTRADSSSPTGLARTRFPNDVIPQSAWDPVGAKVVGMYPNPMTTTAANNFTQSPARRQTDDTFDARLDHKLSESDNLFTRYSFNDTSTTIPSSFPVDPKTGLSAAGGSFPGTALQRSQNVTMGETHTFSPRLVGDFKFAYSRIAINSLPTNHGTFAAEKLGIRNANVNQNSSQMPNFPVSGYTTLGDSGWIPLITYNNLFQPAANLLYARGAHSLKVGADMRRRQVAQYQSSWGVGQFSFTQFLTNDPATGAGGHSVASLLLGYPATTTRSLYLVSMPGYRILEYATYIQDDWRAASWLTLNLGLRYEYFSPISEATNRISNFDVDGKKIVIAGQGGVSNTAGVKPDRNDFAPRLGIAATFARHWVLRGGFGVSFNPSFMGSDQAFRNPPFSSLYGVTTSTPGYPANRLSDGLPVPTPSSITNPSGSINAVAFNNVTPLVKQFNVTLQRQLSWGLVGTASYVGVRGNKLALSVPINEPAPGAGNYAQRRPYFSVFPNLSGIALWSTLYDSTYDSLQASLERRFSSGFGLLANYTWGHAIDNAEVRLYGANAERRLVKGNSGADIRQRFTLTSNFRLPFNSNILVKDWQLNAIAVLQAGIGMTITNSVTTLNGGGPSRANLVGNPVLPRNQRTLTRYFNTAAYAAPPNFTYGNAQRGAFPGPGRVNFDLSVHREFSLAERVRAQFRAEGFNIMNTPPFANPGTALGTASFGVISSAGDPRRIQLALKLLF